MHALRQVLIERERGGERLLSVVELGVDEFMGAMTRSGDSERFSSAE